MPGAVEDVPREALREIFEVNLFGPFDLINRCLPLLRAAPEARVVNCSSVLGFAAIPFRGAYSATKFAMEGMTDTLRRENRGGSIRYILIEPGPIGKRETFADIGQSLALFFGLTPTDYGTSFLKN